MADLLGLLRDFSIHNKEIKEDGDEIIFNNYAWPKSAKTNYVVWGSDRHGSTKEYYPLESLVYFLKNINLSHAQFVRQSAASNILGIRLPDRQKLLDYLQGRITTCEAIDHSLAVDISQRRLITTTVAAGDNDGSQEPPNKRLCSESMRNEDEVDKVDEETQLREQQRLAAKLDLPAGGKMTNNTDLDSSSSTLLSTSLTEHIPVDKIQLLRAKFRAKHQQTIKNDDGELRDNDNKGDNQQQLKLQEDSMTVGGAGQLTGSSVTKMAVMGGVGSRQSIVREILSREYSWRTRTSVLQSCKKTFFDSVVLGTLKSVKMKEENLGGSNMNSGGAAALSSSRGPLNNNNNVKPVGGDSQQPAHYSRYDQERFTGAGQDTAGFKIDTMGSYHGKALSSMMTEGQQQAAAASRDPRQAHRPVGKGSTINNIESGVKSAQSTPRGGSGSQPGVTKSKSRVPIIIIPAGSTSLITMYNAKDILQDLHFSKTEDKKASSTGCRRDNELLIQRQKSDGRTVPYRVIDQPAKLSREEWERVVAVFVQGPAWQFKAWPIGGQDPVEIFNMVKAFHLKAAHMPLHPDVKKWNVHVVELDDRRHLDKANFQQVWDILDRHMIKTKPHLRF